MHPYFRQELEFELSCLEVDIQLVSAFSDDMNLTSLSLHPGSKVIQLVSIDVDPIGNSYDPSHDMCAVQRTSQVAALSSITDLDLCR
jgi:hypothetical protein